MSDCAALTAPGSEVWRGAGAAAAAPLALVATSGLAASTAARVLSAAWPVAFAGRPGEGPLVVLRPLS